MTDDQFTAWAADPEAIRCVLVEVAVRAAGTETTRYLSNLGYVSGPSDTPANTAYAAVVAGGVTVSETLPLNGRPTVAWGDVEVSNPDGEFDSWLDDIWSGRAIKVLVGDVRWPRADFRTVFSGVVEDITARSQDRLNLLLRDKSQRLNTPISEATIDNASATKDALKPLCFGEVHNVTPVLIDPGTLTYMVHNGPIEGIIEVRDNGIPVTVGVNLGAGTFSLTASPVGTITASVQGCKAGGVYRTRVSTLVSHIATTYGSSPLAPEDVDADQLAAFDAAHPQQVGVYIPSRANTLDVLQQLASSVGAQVSLSGAGRLQVRKIALPAAGTPAQFGPAEMVFGTLSVGSTPKLEPAVRLAYCRNYTVQAGLTTGLPAAHTELYGREWLVAQVKDDALAGQWNLSTSPEEVSSLLLTRVDAEAEASRRLALWGARRQVLKFESHGAAVVHALGDPTALTHSRFGLSGGKSGQIVGKRTDWLTQKVSFEVLV